jgi:hypothetical protein
MKDPVSFWKVSGLPKLTTCAKIIFSVPVSSAGIERLFSEAGMLLTKQRKRMLPNVKKLICIRYKKKYRKLMDRLGIFVNEEEVEKKIADDGTDESETVSEEDDDMAD